MISVGLLVIYAFTVYNAMDESWLGFVTMIAVVITDFILYLIYNSKIIISSTMLSVTVIFNRLFLFVFGGEYWIYGYMILYIYYGILLVNEIGKRRFPIVN